MHKPRHRHARTRSAAFPWPCQLVLVTVLIIGLLPSASGQAAAPSSPQERIVEWTITSKKKSYADPFNDVELDVVFSKDGKSWRVPTFWRGGQTWTVRFSPPLRGEYDYRLQSTDPSNSDLNGHQGRVTITEYNGPITLLRHGALRVSANKRHFEHADGTPFYWLGDTWWTGLSDRLSWEGFQKLTADRKSKGFTLVQIVAGLIPPEELAPIDPGYRNEGGAVWDADFKRINPSYFDYADRRIQHLLDQGLVPAIVGAWGPLIDKTGVSVLKKHWRYIIARYGAYPVIWVVGGEVFDPPPSATKLFPAPFSSNIKRGWTEVTRYVRDIDPSHHPLTVHESFPPFDFPVQDESLTDFDLFQSSHWGWGSVAAEVAQMNTHYARTSITKPIVQGEIGYEKLGEIHLEDFQRTAFWLSMLNGAAGHTYGANGTWEAYTGDKPLHRWRHSFMTWEEGMTLPGSYQVGLGASLLRNYRWWEFQPHPEWVSPHGTTLLEPRTEINDFDIGREFLKTDSSFSSQKEALETKYPGGEWQAKHGTFRLPYAAGIPGEVRVIYIPPQLSYLPSPAPTILGLETDVRYRAYLWDPARGIQIDLGAIQRTTPSAIRFSHDFAKSDPFRKRASIRWIARTDGPLHENDEILTVTGVNEADAVVSVGAQSSTPIGLLLRYQDTGARVTAIYSPGEKTLYLTEHQEGRDGQRLGTTSIPDIDTEITLRAEVRGGKAAASVTDGKRTYTTPIVDVSLTEAGTVGLLHRGPPGNQRFDTFEVRASPDLVVDDALERSLQDAVGRPRGELAGAEMTIGTFKVPAWDAFGRDKHILLDAYRPEKLPTSGDWVLVLETEHSRTR